MRFLQRLLLAMAVLCTAAGCSTVFEDYTASSVDAPAPSPVFQGRGHVYLLRGLMGEVFSRGLDTLADKIYRQGIAASVHSSYSVGGLADEVIGNYRRNPGPIFLIGHSTGADAAITIAKRLREAKIPVAMVFGLDPTRIADNVPDNVELFVNLFQKTNPIGGGVVKSGGGFHGRLVNIDLREHSGLMHITMDKSSAIHDAIVSEIVGFIARGGSTPQQNFIRPYFLAYVVPPNEPIQIWDSGIQVGVQPGEDSRTIASNYRIPLWLLAQVNRLDPNGDLPPGKQLIVPQHMYSDVSNSAGVSTYR